MSKFTLHTELNNTNIVPRSERRGDPRITKYERAKILGVRAAQLSRNAPANIDTEGETDVLQIAMKEFRAGVLPLVIQRHLPNGQIEEWQASELRVPADWK